MQPKVGGTEDVQSEEIISRDEMGAIMELALDAGKLLLENGAEISRVSETMQRISRHYGVESARFFTLSNGIFASCGSQKEPLYASVEQLPVQSGRLDWVCAVNQLSREIESGMYTVEEARAALERIRQMPGKKNSTLIVGGAVAAAGFALMFGGGWLDCLAAFLAGFLSQIFLIYVCDRYLSRIVGTMAGGAFITFWCIVFYRMGIGSNLIVIIMSTVALLVPGIPFVNGIRDIAASDYLSGAVRLLDATFRFACIAIGVAACFMVYNRLFGMPLL